MSFRITLWDVAKSLGKLYAVPGANGKEQHFYIVRLNKQSYVLVEDDYATTLSVNPARFGTVITHSRFLEHAPPADGISAMENELRQTVLELRRRARAAWERRRAKRAQLRVYWRGDKKIIGY